MFRFTCNRALSPRVKTGRQKTPAYRNIDNRIGKISDSRRWAERKEER